MHDDAIVVGGGVVGASAAYRLARAGARVRLVDAALPGYATAAGAGIISPGTVLARDATIPDGFLPLAFRGGAYYAEMHDHLAEDGETDTGFGAVGSLTVATDAAEADRLPMVMERMRERLAAGVALMGSVELIDMAAAKQLFPPLTETLPGFAIYTSGAARVDGRLLLASLKRAAERRGATITNGTAELVVDGKGAIGVRVDGEVLPAGAVLLATGAWTGVVGNSLGVSLPVEPERGQIAHMILAGTDVSRWPTLVSFTDTSYMVSFAPNRLAAGATREGGVGFDPRQTARGVHSVLSTALQIAPGLADSTLLEVRVGLRPVSRDKLPVMGRLPGLDNVFVCAGHGHSGLLMGPYAGAIMGDLIRGCPPELDLAPYAVERFDRV
jgi:D-amino-acid dehydrogenase